MVDCWGVAAGFWSCLRWFFVVVPCALLQWFFGCLLTVLFDCCVSSDGPGWLLVAFWRSCLIVDYLWTCFFESVVGVSRELLLDLEPGGQRSTPLLHPFQTRVKLCAEEGIPVRGGPILCESPSS